MYQDVFVFLLLLLFGLYSLITVEMIIVDMFNGIVAGVIAVVVGIFITLFKARGDKIKRLEIERDNLNNQVKVDKIHQETLKKGEDRINEVKEASIDKDIDELVNLFNTGGMPDSTANTSTDTGADSNKTR